MPIPTADQKLEMIRLAEPTPEELAAVASLAPGDYEIGFQRTNDILNDALYGGIHNPDQVIVLPIFHEGKLIAWAGAANHTTETGAVEPGGMPVSATTRFHEGLNLPPIKIGDNGQLREDWL